MIFLLIKDRLLSLQQLPVESKTISSIEDITEVLSMYETRTKQWATIFRTPHALGLKTSDIRKITGMSISKIEQLRKKLKRR
jgi:DNA-binding transcriptional regulator GbsR (MarR family)